MQTAHDVIQMYRRDPVAMVRNLFQVEPYPWQAEALISFAEDVPKKRIAVQSFAGPGKTALGAWMAWNTLLTQYDHAAHPKGAVTSCTSDNLRDNLWAEIAKWLARSPILDAAFKWTGERVFAKESPADWFLSARTYSKTASEDEMGRTLSGLHASRVLMLIDESGGTPSAVARSAEQTFSSDDVVWARIAQFGNPTSKDSMLHDAATTLAHQWHYIRLSGDPDDPKCVRAGKSLEWAREQIATYGRDNPWVQAYVLGNFPDANINALLGPDEVDAAMNRNPSLDDYAYSQRRLGVDCARFGDDATVIFPRQGLVAYQPAEMRGARSHEIAARIAVVKERFNSEVEFIDDTGGYGSGVIDALLQAGHAPVPVNFSSRASNAKYFNRRSEMWFEMAEWVKRGGALPLHPQLKRELCAPTYTFQGGKFRLEEKDQIKARLKFSPDFADALALTFSQPEMPSAFDPLLGVVRAQGKIRSDFDPFAGM